MLTDAGAERPTGLPTGVPAEAPTRVPAGVPTGGPVAPSWRRPGRPRWSDVALLVLAFGVVLQARRWAGGASLWLDEQMIARNIRDRGFVDLAAPLDHEQSAPLGWLWAQRAVVELLGTGERTLRLLPFLFAVGSLVVAWLICRRWLGVAGSCAVLALLAVNPSVLRYSSEVKQYSGDVFWVLLLLGVALWVLDPARAPDGSDPGSRARRVTLWWLVAAVACLFSMGAVLATPALALILVGTAWRRGGWGRALRASLPGIIWLAAFGLHYWFSLRHALANDFLARFWAWRGYPPENAGPRATAQWLVRRLEVLGGDPLHLDASGLGRDWLLFACVVFWTLAVLGALAATRFGLPVGLVLAAPTVSAFVLAVLWISPLYMRLAMWTLPALFLSVGFAIDAAARVATRPSRLTARLPHWAGGRPRGIDGWPRWLAGLRRRTAGRSRWAAGLPRWIVAASGALVIIVAAVPYVPIVNSRFRPAGLAAFHYRDATQWLQHRHRPGDLTIGIYGNQHAIGWYDPAGRLAPVEWARAAEVDEECDPNQMRDRLAGFDRVLVYGDLRNGTAERTADALAAMLTGHGETVAEGDFGWRGMVRIVELDAAPVGLSGTAGLPCLHLTPD